MGAIDKLRLFINEPKADITNLNYTRKCSQNVLQACKSKGFWYDSKSGKVVIHADHIPVTKRALFQQIITDYIAEGEKLCDITVRTRIDELYDYTKKKSHRALLEFYDGVIPYADYEALEASLYIRDHFVAGENVEDLKRDISMRHGERGRNIANLCTAQYFDTFLFDLYNSLDNKDQYRLLYEEVVKNSVMAVFVSRETKPSDISTEITRKLELSKKFGINYVHVHGIGKKNVTKIKECLQKQKVFFDFYEKHIYENSAKDIIVLEVIMK